MNLEANFSILLMCIVTAGAMLGTIFTGLANTLFRYIISVIMAAVAVLIFGYVAADIVDIVVSQINTKL